MSKPLTDGREVDSRLQEKDGGRMPQGMGMDPLLLQRAGCSGSGCDVLLEQVTNAKAGQLVALAIHEERRFAAP
ncbi:hypothetical protein XH99_00810 [Bradyrhizobium nanningense]|uniref:Uncharacterized protein n=1 Tax=Bradyrhizobium nanningense TaxID=1325118 RepID=A0A4Q0SHH8_9BRAD|nr:hypothetical protein XH99_00810 [Bradyrhizobium nanningense]